MKKWILLCLVPTFAFAQTNQLDLAQVRSRVLAQNPSVRESLHRIEAASAVLAQARSAYLPTVSFSGDYGSIDASQHPDFAIQQRVSDSMTRLGGSLEANWLLFDGFARRARTLAAKDNLQRSREMADETRRLLVLSATVTFRQAQLAIEHMKIAEQDKGFNRDLEEDASARYVAGTLPQSEVMNFTIRALSAESAFVQARLELQTAMAVLTELMALPQGHPGFSVQPSAMNDDAVPMPSLDDEFAYALDHRPDYQAMHYALMAAGQQEQAAKGDLMPKFGLIGQVGYVEYDGKSTSADHGDYESYIGVGVQWDLFTGGRKSTAIRQSHAEMLALDQQRESLRLAIRSSIQQRIDAAMASHEILERQKSIHDLSAKVRDDVEKMYRVGTAPITRLNEAQTDLVRAEGAYASACTAYQLALNQLDIETGRVLSQP